MAYNVGLDLHLKDATSGSAALHRILTQTRARPGNVSIEVLVDSADPAHVVVAEVWEAESDHDAYRQWRATPEGASGLDDLLSRPRGVLIDTDI
jgi:quinol monooxygenase YgiN